MKKRKYWFFKNPIKWYIQSVRDAIEPSDLSHRVRMNIDIPKGKTKGRALIPCAIYSFDHSIDLNPALIRRIDNKRIKEFPVNRGFSYDSKKYDVELTEQEKRLGYTLNEIEKCEHCGQRLVIAEVAETRYRSCPDIKVRIADKAKEDLRIPVDFGINKSDVISGMWSWLILDILSIILILALVFKFNLLEILIKNATPYTELLPYWVSWIILAPFGIFLIVNTLVLFGRAHYRAYMLWNWWRKIRPTLTKVRVAK